MYNQIKRVSNFLKKKYPGRNTLKLDQVADEFLMTKAQIRDLKNSAILKTLSIRSIATFVVENPPKYSA